jgi:hypothetical protein
MITLLLVLLAATLALAMRTAWAVQRALKALHRGYAAREG